MRGTSSRMHRTAIRGALRLLLAAAIATACSRSDESSRKTRDTVKDELVVAVGGDEFSLQLNRHRLGMYPLNASICEPLFRLEPSMITEPALAAKTEYLGDGAYRFVFRDGVTFHDGSPLTARAVAATLHRSIRLRTQLSFMTDSSVNIVNDSTLDIKPSIPNLRLVEQLAHPTYGVTSLENDPTRNPVCTGPFRFVEYVPKSHLTVERYDAYWGSKARLQRLTFRFIPDDNTRALALRAGEVNAIYDVNRGIVGSLEKTPGINVVTSPPGSVLLMYIATNGSPPYTIMSDPAVRRAVAMAIDRKLFVERVLGGYAAVVTTVNPPVTLGSYANAIHGIPYNLAAARRTLDSSGWRSKADGIRTKGGRTLELSLISQASGVDRQVNEFIQAQLAAAGIRLKVEQLEPGAFDARLNAGQFDLDIEVPNQNDGNPAFLLALRWYSKSNVRSAKFMLAGERFDSLVTASLASPRREDAQRFAGAAMHELVDVQAAAIPLAGLFRIYALNDRVRGFEPHPSRASQWWNTVWIAK